MSVEAVAAAHYAAQRAITAAVGRSVAAEWAKVDPKYLDASFAAVAPRLTAVVVAGQVAAASQADTYVRRVLAEQNVNAPPEGRVSPRGFAGTAADGRSLTSLLAEPLIAAKVASGNGGSLAEIASAGLASLLRIIGSEIPDAGRTADGVAISSRPGVTGYVRMLSPPSCSRCAILAGHWYRWNAGFQRHPRCDCRHIPAAEDVAGDLRTDPLAALKSGQVTGMSKADSQAILRDGADMNQVVNARRGMYTAGGRRFTTESTTKRGVATGQLRPRPEQIYRDAADRADAIRLLKRFAYIT